MDSRFISLGLGEISGLKAIAPQKKCVCYVVLHLGLRVHTLDKRKESQVYLLTNCVPLQPIKISVKQCGKCKGLYQVFPYDFGRTLIFLVENCLCAF